MTPLAERQAALVEALVAGGELPPGFDGRRVAAAREALVRKRSGEVAGHWPVLAASFGPQWTVVFGQFAAGRPTAGWLRDGWDLARQLDGAGRRSGAEPGSGEASTANVARLTEAARAELRTRERLWRYDGASAPRRRVTGRLAALLHRLSTPR
jgi:hypothetical protein